MNILEKILERTKLRVQEKRAKIPLKQMQILASKSGNRADFLESLRSGIIKDGFSLICEVKKASPSKGVIAKDFPYLQIAKDYAQGGANAISVLSEPEFFLGSDEYLSEIAKSVEIPLLRKDFIIDEYLIFEAKTLGASAILLIARALDSKQLKDFYQIANELNLSTLFEVHSKDDLEKILPLNPKIIGINNRNLETFSVDLGHSIELKKEIPEHILCVSESGIKNNDDVKMLKNSGIFAALIGESLMKEANKASAIATLRA